MKLGGTETQYFAVSSDTETLNRVARNILRMWKLVKKVVGIWSICFKADL
jgi:hypothetical protein